ncbi:hypothetical protein GCM10009856_56380 [Mycolicibacterium llatzerense]
MEETVSFGFANLGGVTFSAIRTVDGDSEGSISARHHTAGWIRVMARDDLTGDIVMDGGSTGPETGEEAGFFTSKSQISTYFTCDVTFRFASLPGVTFHVSRSTDDENDEGGQRRRGWVSIVGRRNRDGAFVFGSGIAGPERIDGNVSPYSNVSRTPAATSLALHRLRTLAVGRYDWGSWGPAAAGRLLAIGAGDRDGLMLDLLEDTQRTVSGGGSLWGSWQPVALDPNFAIGTIDHGVKVVANEGVIAGDDESPQAALRNTAGLPRWGTWAYVDGRWRLLTGVRDTYRLWDPVSGALTSQRTHEVGELSWGCAVHLPSTHPPSSSFAPTTLLLGGSGTGVWMFELAGRGDSLLDASVFASNLTMPRVHHSGTVAWGCATTIAGVGVVATGGPANEVILWCFAADGVTSFRLPLGDTNFGPTTWGSWGFLGNEPVLAVGGPGSGGVHIWYPSMRAAGQKVLDSNLYWGAWGLADGQAVLAGSDDTCVGIWEVQTETLVSARPDYHSDTAGSVEDIDVLDRQADAAALAELITSRTARPPLAVGIFGQWGEGKSHFMGLLHREVARASEFVESDAPAFADAMNRHQHVRQVRFNAWHYSETDLWASIVSEIFGQLGARGGRSDGIAEDQRQQSRLLSEIIADRRLPERIAAEKDRCSALKSAASRNSFEKLSRENKAELKEALVAIDPDLASEFQTALDAALEWAKFRRGQITRVARAIPWWRVGIVAGLALAILVVVISFSPALPGKVAGGIASTFVLGVGYWNLVSPHLAALQAQLRRGRDAATKIREAARNLTASLNRDVELALSVSEATIITLENELRDLTAAGQLAGLVAERATNKTYRESLGLMTEIREDFERMSKLLAHDRSEFRLNDVVGDELPQIDRIVLYIDDLDRCPPKRVVEVLEAVHLMLATELFVVVLAVDPRWLHRAVAVHYRDVLTEEPHSGGVERWASTPTQYLDKIFQIILNIAPLETAGYSALLDNLVNINRQIPEPINDLSDDHASVRTGSTESFLDLSRQPFNVAPPDELPTPRATDRVDPLAFGEDELHLMRLLGPPLITTPRSVKRLVNSYALLTSIRRLQGLPSTGAIRRPALILLAALIGYPEQCATLLRELHRTASDAPASTWHEFINGLPAILEDPARTDDLAESQLAVRRAAWLRLSSALGTITTAAAAQGISLPSAITTWAEWIPSVGRLAYPAGAVVRALQHET